VRGRRRGIDNGAGRDGARASNTCGGAGGKGRAEVVHADGGAEVARIGGGQGFTRACSVDGWRGVLGERGNTRADSPKAPGRPEGDVLGSVDRRCLCTAGAEERHMQA
jgi:hypothetical protein